MLVGAGLGNRGGLAVDALLTEGVHVDGVHVCVFDTLLEDVAIPVAVAVLTAENELDGGVDEL